MDIPNKIRYDMLVSCLLEGKYFYISYNKVDEMKIIEKLYKYNKTFFILHTNSNRFFHKSNTYCLCYDNIDINNLYNQYKEINVDYVEAKKEKAKNNYTSYIYFFAVPNYRDNENYVKYYNNLFGYCIDKYMLDNVENEYLYNNYIIYEKNVILRFCDSKFYEENFEEKRCIISLLGGIGDIFIEYSIIYQFIMEYKKVGVEVCIVLDGPTTNLPELLFDDIAILIYFYNEKIFKYWIEHSNIVFFKKVYDIFNNLEKDADHTINIYKRLLNQDDNCSYYKYNDILSEIIKKNVTKDELDYINGITINANKIIGLQFFTGNYDILEEKWMIGNRKWDIDNVLNFINKCDENNIKVLILNPSSPYDDLLLNLSLKPMSVPAYVYTISKLNLIVGIDSSGGHIASFYNIPSITLWGSTTPIIYYESYNGYRPLRKNFSIVASNKNVSSINYEVVFDITKKILDNTLLLSDDIISYEDSVQGYNTIYI
jgi:hypothetical protein